MECPLVRNPESAGFAGEPTRLALDLPTWTVRGPPEATLSEAVEAGVPGKMGASPSKRTTKPWTDQLALPTWDAGHLDLRYVPAADATGDCRRPPSRRLVRFGAGDYNYQTISPRVFLA